MDKRKVTLSVIAVAVLLVVLVGTTFAYWTLNGTPKVSANVQVQTGGLILRLDDVDGITSKDVIDPNHLSFSKYFSITNESAADGYAKILFKGLTNTFVTDALVYELEEVQSDKSSFATPRIVLSETVLPKSAAASNHTLADGLLIEKGTISGNTVTPNTKYYKLTVRYKYSDTVDQSEDVGATLVSGFTIEEGQSSVTMSVSFVTNDTNITNPTNRTVTYGNNYDLPVLTKEGYRLEGWYLDSELTNRVENGSKVLQNSNHTLYAKWKESKFECLDESGNEMICPKTLAIGQRVAIRDTSNVQVFRYLRTTDTSDTAHSYNECNDGGSASIACTDADSRHSLEDNQLRLLAEYNLYVGAIYDSSANKISDVDTTSATYGLQDSRARGWVNGQNRVATIAYGSSNNNYSQSNVKTYTENYANYLNKTYFGESSEVSGSAITFEELVMLGCNESSYKCSGAPSWVYTSSYWSGSPYNSAIVWCVRSVADLGRPNNYNDERNYGVRPVISISASSI